MNQSIHHLDQSTGQQSSQPTRVCPHAYDRADRLHVPRPSRRGLDRVDRPHACPSPCNSVIFCYCSVILLYSSAILLQWTHSFYFIELSHFSILNPAILPESTQPFCQTVLKFSLSHFAAVNSSIFAILLSHFLVLLQWTQLFCSVILWYCQLFLLH
jgi:hypothetical protein